MVWWHYSLSKEIAPHLAPTHDKILGERVMELLPAVQKIFIYLKNLRRISRADSPNKLLLL